MPWGWLMASALCSLAISTGAFGGGCDGQSLSRGELVDGRRNRGPCGHRMHTDVHVDVSARRDFKFHLLFYSCLRHKKACAREGAKTRWRETLL